MEDEDVTDDLVLDDIDTDDLDAEEEEITFGDEPETKPIAEIRNAYKDKAREAAELKRRVAELEEKVRPNPIEVGPKPTREQFDYDDDAYDEAVDKWHEDRVAAQQQQAEIAKPDEELQQRFQQKVEAFKSGIATLGFADAQDKVDGALAVLNVAQQSAIVKAAKDPSYFVYALGRNPEKLAALAEQNDLAEFIAEVVRLEMIMTTRKRPAADTPVSGNAPAAVKSTNKVEEKLIAEAERTGDRTKLIRWRKEQRQAA